MERPPVPEDARGALEVWTSDDGFGHQFHVADGEDAREVASLLRLGVAEVLEGKRPYALDEQVWLAQLVLRGKQVGCGYGTLDVDPDLLRHSLRDLSLAASSLLETAADRRVLEHRLEILDAIDRAMDRWDLFSALVAASADRTDAHRRLAGEPFRFIPHQAEHVLDLSIARRTRAGREAVREEIAAVRSSLDELGRAGEPPASDVRG